MFHPLLNTVIKLLQTFSDKFALTKYYVIAL